MDAGALALLVVAAVELVGLVVLATLLLGLRRRQRGTDVQRHDVEAREHRRRRAGRAAGRGVPSPRGARRGDGPHARPDWPRSRRRWWSPRRARGRAAAARRSTPPG